MKSSNSSELSRWLATWRTQPIRIALLYTIVSGIWIIASDSLVYHFVRDHELANRINVFKGWGFVLATACMLWLLVHRLLVRVGTSEARLRLSEQQARAVFNGVSEAIFIHDAVSGEILEVNQTACDMFGYTQEQFRHLAVEDLSSRVPPYDQENARIKIEAAMNQSQSSFQWQCRHRDGRLFWTEVNATPAVVGIHTRVLVTARNIDEGKRISEQVRKLSQAVEQNPVSIIITDLEGTIEYVNPATCQLTGYTADELIGRNPRVLKSDDTPPGQYEQLWNTILQGGEWRGTFRNLKKNGEPYWEAASISPITDDSGKITHFLAVKENITERLKADETLRNQEALLREAGEIAHVGGWEFDPLTGIGSYSPEVARIYDLDLESIVNKDDSISYFHGESRATLEEAIAAAVRDGTPYDLELELISAIGRKKWVRTICRPIMENGRVIRVRGSIQDISDRKRTDEELQESRARLRALLARLENTRETERTRIAREIHDVLGQLLTGIKMDLSWLERRLNRIENIPLRQEFTDKIAASHALTDSMLKCVQKISQDLRPSLLDQLGLTAAIQSEVRQFSNRTDIACDISSLPDFIDLPTDSTTQVFRIFQEILTNVARHSGASRVTISMLRNGNKWNLQVGDNGCGIPPDAFRDPASLGLLGMSERAKLIGGSVRFCDRPDGGTLVDLTIPDTSNPMTQ